MVLTPDQKKRIAALDAKPVDADEEPHRGAKVASARLKALGLSMRMSSFQPALIKLLIACVLFGVAGFFIVDNQLHKIDFRAVFSSGRGSPVTRLSDAVKVQRKKTELLAKGRGQLLGGDYKEAFKTAMEVKKLDPEDIRAWGLIDDTVDSVTQKAIQEFEAGKIEVALADVRLGLKYNKDHETANELYMDIADRLLLEAQTHYNKKEYPKQITKAHEVLRIDPSNMAASNLLVRTNSELLAMAGELFISKRYFGSLEMVRLSLQIDRTNPGALSLLKRISDYVDTPKLELRGIIKKGDVFYARILLPDSGEVMFVKKDDIKNNFKVLDIDSKHKRVKLMQIHTKQKFTIQQVSPG